MPNARRTRTVGDVMSREVLTVSTSETVADASAHMNERKVGSVLVTDGTRVLGILTERDLIKTSAAGVDTSIAKVSEWMTPDPDTISSDVGIQQAFTSLWEHGYRHIPVVDDGELRGVVTMRDLMKVAQIEPVEQMHA